MGLDLHQHLWPELLVDRLRARSRAPYLRGWTLHTASEAPYDVTPADHDPQTRIELDHTAEVAHACVSLSAPLGIESLPSADAVELIDAWHLGAFDLPSHFSAWASVPAVDPDLDKLSRALLTFVGVQLPASLLLTPQGWQSVGEVLRVAELAGKPVLVHPGPVTSSRSTPGWWPAVVGYVEQLQAAWWGWHAFGGREQFPDLRVVFAAGAGLAPLHHERFTARGGGRLVSDPLTFVDTSSYGPQAVDALIRVLGVDAIVLGSDRPYAEPARALFGEAATKAIRVDNPRRVLGVPRILEEVA